MQNINYQKEVGRLELQGEVVEVIYKNEINSYCIAVFKLDKSSNKYKLEVI